jgi:hypothetical protein
VFSRPSAGGKGLKPRRGDPGKLGRSVLRPYMI